MELGETIGGGLNRREALARLGGGFGAIALASLLRSETRANPSMTDPLAARTPELPAKAKRVVFFFLNGGPSHVDTLDPKPLLNKLHGQPAPASFARLVRGQVLGSPFRFEKRGKSGIEISELFPKIGEFADDLCVIRSMRTDAQDHSPGMLLMNCGHMREVRASMGAWVLYGLGTLNQSLPGFVAFCPAGYPNKAQENWHAAFLPGIFQGVYVDSAARNDSYLPNLKNPRWSPADQRRQLDLTQSLNRMHQGSRGVRDELETRIRSLELAYRMQSEASDAFDLSRESEKTRSAYGMTPHGNQALLARRLLERGVRFVQLYHGLDKPWDTHDANAPRHRDLCASIDQPIAALLADLKARDMLKDTLVVCAGEFGRTPTAEVPFVGDEGYTSAGRDHNRRAFSIWLAGGGVRAGSVIGASDELGCEAVENPVHVHDLHATILRLLGIDHTHLTFPHQGREIRLTDGLGRVVEEVLA